MKSSLQEAIDNYQRLKAEIAQKEELLAKYKETILSSIKPTESKTANTYRVRVGKASFRFSHYEDEQLIKDLLQEVGYLKECTKLNRPKINELIESGKLPKQILDGEVKCEQPPRLMFEPANTWEDAI